MHGSMNVKHTFNLLDLYGHHRVTFA